MYKLIAFAVFLNLKIEILTSLNKWVICSPKSFSSCKEIKILSKSSKSTKEASSSAQPKAMYGMYMQLSLWCN